MTAAPDAVPTPGGLGVGVPLAWTGDAGYQCPRCSLFVCIPQTAWSTCPRCAPIPIDEAAALMLSARTGLDEDEAVEAAVALTPLFDLLARARAEGAAEAWDCAESAVSFCGRGGDVHWTTVLKAVRIARAEGATDASRL